MKPYRPGVTLCERHATQISRGFRPYNECSQALWLNGFGDTVSCDIASHNSQAWIVLDAWNLVDPPGATDG